MHEHDTIKLGISKKLTRAVTKKERRGEANEFVR